jgi:membrane protein DedA with SNARE-associated domain
MDTPTLIGGLIGVVIGALVGYWIGTKKGRPVLGLVLGAMLVIPKKNGT